VTIPPLQRFDRVSLSFDGLQYLDDDQNVFNVSLKMEMSEPNFEHGSKKKTLFFCLITRVFTFA